MHFRFTCAIVIILALSPVSHANELRGTYPPQTSANDGQTPDWNGSQADSIWSRRSPVSQGGDRSSSQAGQPPSNAEKSQDGDARPDRAQAQLKGRAGPVNTWAMFGFVDGSDTGAKGERTPFQESVIRLSRGNGEFAALRGSLGLAYSISDSTIVWLSGANAYEQNTGTAGITAANDFSPTSSLGFGASAGLKYRVLERGPSPVGVSVQIEPSWERTSKNASGLGTQRTIASEFKLIMDTALLPDRLFAALNLTYEPEARFSRERAVERESSVEIAAAVSARALDKVFIGAEVRYLTKYQSYFLVEPLGRVLFVGPTLYFTFGESAYAGIAWSVQVVGRAREDPTRNLDLVNFEHHQARLKMGFTF